MTSEKYAQNCLKDIFLENKLKFSLNKEKNVILPPCPISKASRQSPDTFLDIAD
jgi:hypothetical protein